MECNKKNKRNLLKYEKELWNKGYDLICGFDEVGRGCVAGPLVACAVILPKDYNNPGIDDSKSLSKKQRKILTEEIEKVALDYYIHFASANVVDTLNPKRASIDAMECCLKNLKLKPDFLLIDYEKINSDIGQLNIVKGDQLSQSIAAASILAKHYRDEYMNNVAKTYPEYDFENNKGYLSKKHLDALKKYGPIENIHRFSYKPIKNL